jgi:hypothetical protein|nr:MAG TPA: hypothetical protein [Herelleviridae sp.]
MPGKFRYSQEKHYLKELFESMRNMMVLNSLPFSYPLSILMRVSYNPLIVI